MNFSFYFLFKDFIKPFGKSILNNTVSLSIAGLIIGVASLMVSHSLLTGYEEFIEKSVSSTLPNFYIHAFSNRFFDPDEETIKKLEKMLPGEHYSPFIQSEGMIKNGSKVAGCSFRGIDLQKEIKLVGMDRFLSPAATSLKPGECIIGKEIAAKLGVKAGDEITVMTNPGNEISILGYIARENKFRVKSIYDCGFYLFNSQLFFLPIEDAALLFETNGSISGFGLNIQDKELFEALPDKIKSEMGFPFTFTSWKDLFGNLLYMISLQKTVLFIIIAFLIIIASSNLSSLMIKMLTDSRKQIGILKSLGAPDNKLIAIFLLKGLLIGTIGTLSGLLAGYIIIYLFSNYNLITIPGDIYFISEIPFSLSLELFALVFVVSLAIIFLSIIFPVIRSIRSVPARILSYDQ